MCGTNPVVVMTMRCPEGIYGSTVTRYVASCLHHIYSELFVILMLMEFVKSVECQEY